MCDINDAKNCPNCGSHHLLIREHQYPPTYGLPDAYYVNCCKCGCSGPKDEDKEKAIALWNKWV